MTDDDLRRLFENARIDVPDTGFARRVLDRIERLQRRRRIVLAAAVAAGAVVALPALLRVPEFVMPIAWAHAAGQLFGVIALSAGAIAVWLLSLTAEG